MVPGPPPPPPGDPGPDGSNKRTLAIVGGIVAVVVVVIVLIVLLTRGDDDQVATAPTTAPPATAPPTTVAETTTTAPEATTTAPETTTTVVETTTTVAETTTTVAETTTTVSGGDQDPTDCPAGTMVPGGETLSGSFDTAAGAAICLAVDEPTFVEIRITADDDTTLTLLLDGQEIAFDDDTYGLDPAILRPFAPGLYVMVVENYLFSDTTTSFEVSTLAVPVTDDGCELGLTLGVGEQVGGLVDNDLGRVACFVVDAPGVHEVRVEADFDTTLTVFRDGEEIDFDDDTYGVDPAVTRPFEPGLYLLLIRNFSTGVTDNAFSLTAN